jgi:hypothetical protein
VARAEALSTSVPPTVNVPVRAYAAGSTASHVTAADRTTPSP